MSLNSFRTGLGSITSSPVGKWSLFAVGALLVFSLVFSGMGSNLMGRGGGGQAAPVGDDVIATVNGAPITRQEYDTTVDSLRSSSAQAGQAVSVMQTPSLNAQALEQLVATNLEMQFAKQSGITVSADEIAKKRAEVVDLVGLRQKLSLPPTASLADVDAALSKAGARSTEDQFSDDALRQLILLGDPQIGLPGKLSTALADRENVSEADARAAYVQYHTQHILIDNKKVSDVQARNKAQQILAKAQAPGADFAALARQYSDDPRTKAKGGDDGFISELTPYVPEFKKAAFSLKPGQVTPDLVASPKYGYFLIKLVGTKDGLPKDFDKNKAQYITQIKQQRAGEKAQAAMAGLQDGAKIDVKDPALAGDRALSQAGRLGDPAQAQAKYREAMADYQKALAGNPPAVQKAAVSVALAQVYQRLNQTPQAIAAYGAALQSREDPALEMVLGQLYLQTKDDTQAVPHFQKASQLAWNDQGTHLSLLTDFRTAGRPDLADKETQWLKQYAVAHPAPGGPNGMPPGVSLPPGMSLPPGTSLPPGVSQGVPGTARSAGSVHVTLPHTPKPAQ